MRTILLCIPMIFSIWNSKAQNNNFYASYTNIDSGDSFEEISQTREYADIVVNLDQNKKLIFWKASSYLPYLKIGDQISYLKEILPRKGDGTELRPDRFNQYSRVKLIENNPAQIVVHWRYAPDISKVSLSDFVDEYFTIYPTGRIIRSIRPGKEKFDDWNSETNEQVFVYNIEEELKEFSSSQIETINLKSKDFTLKGLDKTFGAQIVENKGVQGDAGINISVNKETDDLVLILKNIGNGKISGVYDSENNSIQFTSGTQKRLEGNNLVLCFNETLKKGQEIYLDLTEVSFKIPKEKKLQDKPNPEVSSKRNTKTEKEPVVWFRFDEGKGGTTTEAISKYTQQITGDKAIWHKGVSGTGLIFNGWSSEVSLPADKAPFLYDDFLESEPTYELTLEAWIVIKAYPWNWTPVVQQSNIGTNGYFLGVGYFGNVAFKAAIGGSWFELESKEPIPRNRWVHVAATYNYKHGYMKLFIDGNKVAEKETTGREIFMAANNETAANIPVRIGKGEPAKPAAPIRPFFTDVSEFAFDGMIDEVKIYREELSEEEVKNSYNALKPSEVYINNPDLQERILPGNIQNNDFGAYYTQLKFYDTWDNRWRVGDFTDVVVTFEDLPQNLIFWRGTSYIPHWVSENNIWATQEFTESVTDYGCAEPMSDKESRHSHVRIIENTDARIVIHWRYHLVDVKYNGALLNEETGQSDWTDEFHYIYPDGTAVRLQRAWSIDPEDREWHEGIILNGPEQRPEDNIEWDAMTLANLEGETHTYSWKNGPPPGEYWGGGMPYPIDRNIAVMNLKSEYDPFIIGPPSDEMIIAAYNDPREFTKYSKFSWFNHWPMSYVISDGHHAHTTDRTTSTSMFWMDTRNQFYEFEDNYASKIYLHGMTKTGAKGLSELGKSWLYPAKIRNLRGGKNFGYNKAQKAYILNSDSGFIELELAGNEERPIANPAFVIKNWPGNKNPNITINDKLITGSENVKKGLVRNTDGQKDLVIWVKFSSMETVSVKIENTK